MTKSTLASRLKERLEAMDLSIVALADRTKIPRSTLRLLAGEECNAILPPRIYLQGHALLFARELEIPEADARRLFDASYPVAAETHESFAIEAPRIPKFAVPLAAGLGSIALIAIWICASTPATSARWSSG